MIKSLASLMMMLTGLGFIVSMTCPLFAYANNRENYFGEHAKGWHWYDDPKEVLSEEPDEDAPAATTDSILQMDAIRATVNRALNAAILNPTQETVGHYIDLQNQVTHQSEAFEKYWKAALLDSPQLDYSLKHPTNTIAKQVEQDQETRHENAVIQALAQKSGLFFFYRSSCPYCVRFAPIVKDFATTYGITVVPITTDGIALPEFPDSHINQGQAEKFRVTVEPALFAVDPYTHKAFPIAYGLISEADLKKRILDIATRFEGFVQ